MNPLSKEAANAVWDLLVEMGGASQHEDSRRDFVYNQTTEFCREWRFQGMFGFGGKFYRDGTRWRVGHYQEDDSPKRNKTRDAINAKLDEMRLKYTGKEPNEW